VRLLEWAGHDERVLNAKVPAREGDRGFLGPDPFHDSHGLVHYLVPLVVGMEIAVSGHLGVTPPAIRLMQTRPPVSWSKVEIIFAMTVGAMKPGRAATSGIAGTHVVTHLPSEEGNRSCRFGATESLGSRHWSGGRTQRGW